MAKKKVQNQGVANTEW